MARGPKNKSNRLKILKGTKRGNSKKDTPIQSTDELIAPKWLPENCQDHFAILKARLHEHGYDSSTWVEAASLIAMRLQEIDECNDIIKKEGRTYKTIGTNGQKLTKVNPIVNQKNEAMRHLQSLLSEFGLTPASILKVGGSGRSEKKANPWDDF